ncbi:unnamed protein product [Closterium sp. Naga37s-1]|nr:unnamed protein product [Closterium sp. Naga37s-1]
MSRVYEAEDGQSMSHFNRLTHTMCRAPPSLDLPWVGAHVEPSAAFARQKTEYERMHQRCTEGITDWKAFYFNQSEGLSPSADVEGCKYAFLIPGQWHGLGNRIMSLISTFTYAFITHRAILMPDDGLMPSLWPHALPMASCPPYGLMPSLWPHALPMASCPPYGLMPSLWPHALPMASCPPYGLMPSLWPHALPMASCPPYGLMPSLWPHALPMASCPPYGLMPSLWPHALPMASCPPYGLMPSLWPHALPMASCPPYGLMPSLWPHALPMASCPPYGLMPSLWPHALPMASCPPYGLMPSLWPHALPMASCPPYGLMPSLWPHALPMASCPPYGLMPSLWPHALPMASCPPYGLMPSLWPHALPMASCPPYGLMPSLWPHALPMASCPPYGLMPSLWPHALPMASCPPYGLMPSLWPHALPMASCPPYGLMPSSSARPSSSATPSRTPPGSSPPRTSGERCAACLAAACAVWCVPRLIRPLVPPPLQPLHALLLAHPRLALLVSAVQPALLLPVRCGVYPASFVRSSLLLCNPFTHSSWLIPASHFCLPCCCLCGVVCTPPHSSARPSSSATPSRTPPGSSPPRTSGERCAACLAAACAVWCVPRLIRPLVPPPLQPLHALLLAHPRLALLVSAVQPALLLPVRCGVYPASFVRSSLLLCNPFTHSSWLIPASHFCAVQPALLLPVRCGVYPASFVRSSLLLCNPFTHSSWLIPASHFCAVLPRCAACAVWCVALCCLCGVVCSAVLCVRCALCCVCGVRCAACAVWCVALCCLCGVRCAACAVWCVALCCVCGVRCAVCVVWCVALCCVCGVVCSTRCAVCVVWCVALCCVCGMVCNRPHSSARPSSSATLLRTPPSSSPPPTSGECERPPVCERLTRLCPLGPALPTLLCNPTRICLLVSHLQLQPLGPLLLAASPAFPQPPFLPRPHFSPFPHFPRAIKVDLEQGPRNVAEQADGRSLASPSFPNASFATCPLFFLPPSLSLSPGPSRRIWRRALATWQSRRTGTLEGCSATWTGTPEEEWTFFCRRTQEEMAEKTFMMFWSDMYFVPPLYFVPSLAARLEVLFPDRRVFTHVARYILLPANYLWDRIVRAFHGHMEHQDVLVGLQVSCCYVVQVLPGAGEGLLTRWRRCLLVQVASKAGTSYLWDRIVRAFHGHMEHQDVLVGLQVRPVDETPEDVFDRVLTCLISTQYLPAVIPPDQWQAMADDVDDEGLRGAHGQSIGVFVASLNGTYAARLAALYSQGKPQSAHTVTFHSESHDSTERQDDRQQYASALVEMFLLSFSHRLVVSDYSTFGYVLLLSRCPAGYVVLPRSAALGALDPWSLNIVKRGEADWRLNNRPVCQRTESQPCSLSIRPKFTVSPPPFPLVGFTFGNPQKVL